jgi:peptide/nickel transport system permease protein
MTQQFGVDPATTLKQASGGLASYRVRLFLRNKGAVVGLIIMIAWLLIAIFADYISPYPPLDKVGKSRLAPSAQFWLGTDMLGRDMFTRVLHGSRISLTLGVISVLLGSIPGTLLGLFAGYFGGKTDTYIMRFLDSLLAFPGMLLALVIIASLGPSIQNVMIAVGISTLPQYARLVRSVVLSLKQLVYIEAARVVGCSPARIMFRHILPNALSPIIVLSTLQVGNAILVGSGLSFLGLGAQPPSAEWGLMTAVGREVISKAWWISTFPGLAILSIVVSFNLMGDGLRVALDPRMKIG